MDERREEDRRERGAIDNHTASRSLAEPQVVLIVEDDAPLRAVARRCLERDGFSIVEAEDAAGALESFYARRPDIILLDVGLPDGSGFDICSRLRMLEQGAQVPIIVVTGMDDNETVVDAYRSGATDFVAKPVNWLVLSRRIRLLLEAEQDRKASFREKRRRVETERLACLGTWELDLKRNLVVWSEETARILELSSSEPLSIRDFLQHIHPQDRQLMREAILTAVRERLPLDLEHRIVDSSGGLRRIRHQATTIENEFGDIVALQSVLQDITDQQRAEDKIRLLSNYDLLTGLPNRYFFDEILRRSTAQAERSGQFVAVLRLDLDRFKKINESFGTLAGDEILIHVADRLASVLRRSDVTARDREPAIARWEGDGFTILLGDLHELNAATVVARRLQHSLHRPFQVGGRDIYLTASIGIGIFPTDAENATELLRHSDTALHHAKQLGGNRFTFFNDKMNVATMRRLEIEAALHQALESDQLTLNFQPVVDGQSGRVTGVETLLRWQHPQLGAVEPNEFIPVAESAGLMESIDKRVVREACRQLGVWDQAGMPRLDLLVNISGVELQNPEFGNLVESAVRENRVDPHRLTLEITERSAFPNSSNSQNVLGRLRQMGVQVAIDDFGTGTSTLTHLRQFPLDIVKIDRSFVAGIATQADDAAIVSAVIAMAHRLRLKVIAEGVETADQLAFLRKERCDNAQGFLFSVPVAADQLPTVVDRLGYHASPPT